MIYPNCPRCNGPWTLKDGLGYIDCRKCNLSFHERSGDHLYILNIINVGDELDFHFHDNECIYNASDRTLSRVILPLLPVDISAERLKTLLLFS